MEIEKNEKKYYKFCCKNCDFYSNKKTDFIRHQSTRKHRLSHENVKMEIMEIKKTTYLFQCKKCNKEYKSASGLWKHSQKCTICVVYALSIRIKSVFSDHTWGLHMIPHGEKTCF